MHAVYGACIFTRSTSNAGIANNALTARRSCKLELQSTRCAAAEANICLVAVAKPNVRSDDIGRYGPY